MRVLWIVSNATNYNTNNKHVYNGCGWIGSLEEIIARTPNIELYEVFFSRTKGLHSVKNGNVTYYPIKDPYSSKIGVLKSIFMDDSKVDEKKVITLSTVVKDINPDIIQVFGTEGFFGLIAKYVNIPIVLHIQGLINPCYNCLLPPFLSWIQYPLVGVKLRHKFLRLFDKGKWRYMCQREKTIFKMISNYMGRTRWDETVTQLFNPHANYYECWEILRHEFYEEGNREIPSRLKICSTVSNTTYKGVDVILKTAKILKQELGLDFVWYVFGGVNMNFFEKWTNIKANEVHVETKGIVSANDVKKELLTSTVYVHPTYIDNSSNSVCESMILGCPVIASNVGGMSSLIENNKTGILVPPNDPFLLAMEIRKLYLDINLNSKIGNNAKKIAFDRHNPDTICRSVISIYNKVLNNDKS